MSEEEKSDSMEDICLVTDSSFSAFVRRTYTLSSKQSWTGFALFALCASVVLIAYCVGPSYMVLINHDIELTKVNSSNRVFRFELDNLHFLNRFVTLDLSFKKFDPSVVNTTFQIATSVHTFDKNGIVSDEHSQLAPYTLNFDETLKYSDTLRVFSSELVNFGKIETHITVKFTDEHPLPARFQWATADKAHTVISLCIRFLFGAIAVICLVQFSSLKIEVKSASSGIQCTFMLLVVLAVASNPLVILDYFSDSIFFGLLDAFLSQLLFTVCCYIGFVHLVLGDRKNESMGKGFYISYGVAFNCMFVVMFTHSAYSTFQLRRDPVISIDMPYRWLGAFKFMMMFAYIPIAIIVAFARKGEVKDDQFIHVLMVCLYVGLTAITEGAVPVDRLLGTNTALQIYSLAAAGVYVLFFTYLNWPVERTVAYEQSDDPEIEVGDTIDVMKDQVEEVLVQ